MEQLIELEVTLINRLIFIHRNIAGRRCSGGVLVENTAVEAGGHRQGRRVKHRYNGGAGEVILQLSLSQLSFQHHVFQLPVSKGSSLSHPGANRGTGNVCLFTPCLLGPTGGVVF